MATHGGGHVDAKTAVRQETCLTGRIFMRMVPVGRPAANLVPLAYQARLRQTLYARYPCRWSLRWWAAHGYYDHGINNGPDTARCLTRPAHGYPINKCEKKYAAVVLKKVKSEDASTTTTTDEDDVTVRIACWPQEDSWNVRVAATTNSMVD